MLNRFLCWIGGHKEGLTDFRTSGDGRMDYILHICPRCERIYKVHVLPRGASSDDDWKEMWNKPFNWENQQW